MPPTRLRCRPRRRGRRRGRQGCGRRACRERQRARRATGRTRSHRAAAHPSVPSWVVAGAPVAAVRGPSHGRRRRRGVAWRR